MYVYDDIAFRVIEKYDLEVLRSLHNDQSTFMNLLNIDLIDEADQIEWWNKIHNNKNDRRYVLCYAATPSVVFGRLRMQNINHNHRNCEVGLDIAREYRHKGLGRKSYAMLLKYLFDELNMNMVYLRVAEFNPDAQGLYKLCGFKETGRFPKFFFRHGKYWDYILMSITLDEYLCLEREA